MWYANMVVKEMWKYDVPTSSVFQECELQSSNSMFTWFVIEPSQNLVYWTENHGRHKFRKKLHVRPNLHQVVFYFSMLLDNRVHLYCLHGLYRWHLWLDVIKMYIQDFVIWLKIRYLHTELSFRIIKHLKNAKTK